MVWQWNLAHIEALLCQVKINGEFSKWRIIFDNTSTKLCNTGKFTIFWYILLTVVVQSSPNTYFQKRWFLLANTTWKWQKGKNYWKKTKKKFSGIFFDMTSSKKGGGSGLLSHLFSTNVLEQLSNSYKFRPWKFQVNLVSSFRDI